MNVSDAKDIILAYMQRAASALQTSRSQDLVIRAMNNAKRFAQRRHDFELAKAQASVVVSPLPIGGDLTTAVLYGTSTLVSVKKIRRAYGLSTEGAVLPIHLTTRDKIDGDLMVALDKGTVDINQRSLSTLPDRAKLVQDGNQLYFYPDVSAASTVYMAVYKWMPEYGNIYTGTATSTTAGKLVASAATFVTWGIKVGDVVVNTTDGTSATVTAIDSETQLTLSADIFISTEAFSISTGVITDFFLENCFDFILYRSITELNFFLKEDQRVQISQAKLDEAWNSVLAWDTTMVPALED